MRFGYVLNHDHSVFAVTVCAAPIYRMRDAIINKKGYNSSKFVLLAQAELKKRVLREMRKRNIVKKEILKSSRR